MTLNGWVQIALYALLVTASVKPLGLYMARVFEGERVFLSGLLQPLERVIYRVCGIDDGKEQHWTVYAISMLVFSAAAFLFTYALQRLQEVLPLNPGHLGAISPDSAFNTAVSFASNTNWQGYGGETTMSYLTQMAALTVQNFVSAAAGIALAIALIRGFARASAKTVGNFWVDLTRGTLYVLLPLSLVMALVLVWLGVPQNLDPYVHATTLEGAKQLIAQGPAASQIAIKQLGTNGGGFFNVNSAHPFENPNALSNLIEMWAILAISAAPDLHLRRDGQEYPPGLGDLRRHGGALPRRDRRHLLGGEHAQSGHCRRACRCEAKLLAERRQYGRQGGTLRHRKFGDLGDGDDRCIERLGQFHA